MVSAWPGRGPPPPFETGGWFRNPQPQSRIPQPSPRFRNPRAGLHNRPYTHPTL